MKIYVGIDISKQCLDIKLGDQFFQVNNDESGINQLVKAFKVKSKQGDSIALVVCEASGGYERLLVKQLRSKDYPVHLAHANKVRSFAKAKGYLAKTDRIDATVLQEYGCLMLVSPNEYNLSPEAENLGDLLKRRGQLIEDKKRENNRLEHCRLPRSKRSIKSHIGWLEKEIKALDKQIETVRQNSQTIKHTIDLLTSVPAIGDLTASYLVAFLPELGHIPAKNITALVGVVPFNRDSGKFQGKRFIQGGRKIVRDSLYMAAVACLRWNPDLKHYYQRLRDHGKPAKVALIAVMRKLLTLLHSILQRQTPWQEEMPSKAC